MATMIPSATLLPAGDRILGPDGPIARTRADYEVRQPQIDMCNLVDRLIRDGGAGLIEAGTGTGKSLAYLIPAILSGEKIVISTDTIQLQEQLVGKDLPLLKRLLDPQRERPLTFAIAKGRSHFVCIRNAQGLVDEAGLLDEYNLPAQDAAAVLGRLERGWDGDRAHLVELEMADDRWMRLAGEESCTGKNCEYASRCPYLRAKAAYETADVVVTNHTMYLLHHWLLRRTGGTVGMLPNHQRWIADEAHTLSDWACDVFGVEITDRQPAAYIKKVRRQVKRLKLNIREEHLNLENLTRSAKAFFDVWHGAVDQEQVLSKFPPEILELARDLAADLAAQLKPVRQALYWATHEVDPEDTERRQAIERLYSGADLLIEGITTILDPEPDAANVRYAEVTGSNLTGKEVTLHCKPIETKWIFRRILESLDTAVFTSATLATGPGDSGFRSVAEELGLNLGQTETLQVESPFDYPRQVAGYIPKGMPDLPKGAADPSHYYSVLVEELEALIHHTEGGAFILFSNYKDLNECHRQLARRLTLHNYIVLKQGDASKDNLVAAFKDTKHGVLFGTKSFWTGVDIPGQCLRNVIITKIPFPNTLAPLNAARCAKIEANGRNSFGEFSLPRAIRDLRQGFGRLIRTRDDEGIFALLDPRMRTAKYRGQILQSLPDFTGGGDLNDLPRFLPKPQHERAA